MRHRGDSPARPVAMVASGVGGCGVGVVWGVWGCRGGVSRQLSWCCRGGVWSCFGGLGGILGVARVFLLSCV
jgi:hypothetical protein